MYEDSKTIALTIDRFEGGRAILIGEREAEIIVPKRLVPKACGEGDVIHLTLASDKAETARKQQTAKELLNEILSGK